MWRFLPMVGFRISGLVVLVISLEFPPCLATPPNAISPKEPTEAKTAPTQDSSLANQVRRLVRQLEAPQARQRAEAEEALLALGPDVLDHLPEVDPQESPQAAVSLARIRHQLERRLAESVLQASLVSLPKGPTPYWQVFQQLYQQTGNLLRLRSDVQAVAKQLTFTGPIEKKPFWPVLDQLLDAAGLTLYPYASGGELMVVPRSEHEQPRSQGACYVGPLRIAPGRLIAQRDYRSRTGDHLLLLLEVAWEPRVDPVVLRLPHQTVQAQDDQGRPLLPSQPEAQAIVPVKLGQKGAELEIRFPLPDRSATRLESLQGNLTVVLPGAMQRFRFPAVRSAGSQSHRRAGATLTLQEVRKEGSVWQVEVVLRYDRPSEAFQSHYHWFYRNRAWLESEDGQKVSFTRVEPFRHTDSEIGLRYEVEAEISLDSYSLIYEAPGLLLTESFPFRLQKLPLP